MIEYSGKNRKIIRKTSFSFSKMIIHQSFTLFRTFQDTTEWDVLFIKDSTIGQEDGKNYIKRSSDKDSKI